MAFDNNDEAYGPPAAVPFGGSDSFGANRAYVWNTSRVPAAPTDQNFDGIATNDGKAGVLAIPGLIVRIEANVGAGQTISAGTKYAINTSGQMTHTVGTAFLSLEGLSGGGGGVVQVIRAVIWKNRA